MVEVRVSLKRINEYNVLVNDGKKVCLCEHMVDLWGMCVHAEQEQVQSYLKL